MSQSQAPENQASLGFPTIERLIEQENFDDLNRIFVEGYESLEKIAQGKGDLQRKKAAKKAMRSLELTMNLLRDFLSVKEELIKKGLRPGQRPAYPHRTASTPDSHPPPAPDHRM